MSASSPRRASYATPASPRHPRSSIPSRLPSFNENDSRNIIVGFSPPSTGLSTLTEASNMGSPRPPALALQTNYKYAHLSPQLSTPVDQIFQPQIFPQDSPRNLASSPRGAAADLPPRSRRNSAAIVSISLSSRSRSRTPRGKSAQLPNSGSGQATPGRGSSSATPKGDEANSQKDVFVQMGSGDSWPSTTDDFDDWQPTGGMLLGSDEEAIEDDYEEEKTNWALEDEEDITIVKDVLSPGMLFGEGLEFQGEIIEPAVGRLSGEDSDGDMPLRRGGSEAPKALRGKPGVVHHGREKKSYEVVRQLGSGSYAVVYLVKERGGRKREYALKCLSKENLEPEQIDTQLFEATIHLSLPIHKNIVTLHQTLQTKKWLFLMLELCPGEDLFFWLEKSRDASPPPANAHLRDDRSAPMSSSKFSSSSIPFSSSQILSGFGSHLGTSFGNSPKNTFSAGYGASPASLLFAHNNHHQSHHFTPPMTPPTPSLLSAFSANTLLSTRRLRLIASMFSQMCEAVAVCHDAGVSHRDIKPENFICCDSVELESAAEGEMDFGPQAKRKVIVKLTDFGLATTEEESGDVECGSKPYMSYECRNNLGPTYYPPAADVWSLGIVLINMLFHRNPWKDPTEGDQNFDNFLRDPTGFLLAKFTGIGREVAAYLACHVLCTEVEDRVTARDLGIWIKSLPEMIGGRKALRELKMARLETRAAQNPQTLEKGMFAKSPIPTQPALDPLRKTSTSALTSTAPTLSGLPPANLLSHQTEVQPTPDLIDDRDADTEDLKSATTIDEQPTPADLEMVSSPDPIDPDAMSEGVEPSEGDARSSIHKRRKRGVRKGKAAQAALAAAAAGETPSQEERDAMLKELAQASQSLARHLSKTSRPPSEFDANDTVDFPPLGTTPAQAAAAKKTKWKDMMKLSSGNPELAALARRVAERDGQSGGNWSAPAEMQHSMGNRFSSSGMRPSMKHTATVSSTSTAISEQIEEEDWRAQAAQLKAEREEEERTKKAQLAAKALSAGFEPMGAFGKNRPFGQGPAHLKSGAKPKDPLGQPSHRLQLQTIDNETQPPTLSKPIKAKGFSTNHTTKEIHDNRLQQQYDARVSVETAPTTSKSYVSSSLGSTTSTIIPSDHSQQGMNKPKLKGQIQSLAKMLSGLKTKGKE